MFARTKQIAAVRNFRENPTQTPGQRSLIPHNIYDTYRFPATYTTPIRHFTVPINGVANGLTKSDIHTNLSDPGKVEAGQFYQFDRVQVKLKNTAAAADNSIESIAAWYRLLNSSRFRVVVGTAKFQAEFHGSVFTPNIPTAHAGAATFPILAAMAIVPLQHDLEQDIVLADVNGVPQNFYVEQTCEAGEVSASFTQLNGDNADMLITLKGYMERPKG